MAFCFFGAALTKSWVLPANGTIGCVPDEDAPDAGVGTGRAHSPSDTPTDEDVFDLTHGASAGGNGAYAGGAFAVGVTGGAFVTGGASTVAVTASHGS